MLISESEFRAMYTMQGLTLIEIAEQCNCDEGYVCKLRKQYGIPRNDYRSMVKGDRVTYKARVALLMYGPMVGRDLLPYVQGMGEPKLSVKGLGNHIGRYGGLWGIKYRTVKSRGRIYSVDLGVYVPPENHYGVRYDEAT